MCNWNDKRKVRLSIIVITSPSGHVQKATLLAYKSRNIEVVHPSRVLICTWDSRIEDKALKGFYRL